MSICLHGFWVFPQFLASAQDRLYLGICLCRRLHVGTSLHRNVNSGLHKTPPTVLLWLVLPAWGRHLWVEVTSYPNLMCCFPWIIILFVLALGKKSVRLIFRETNRTHTHTHTHTGKSYRVKVTQWRHKASRSLLFRSVSHQFVLSPTFRPHQPMWRSCLAATKLKFSTQ